MRPRINKNLIASSNIGSSSAKIAQHNRQEHYKSHLFISKTPKLEIGDIHYVTIFGKELIIGKDITLQEVKNAKLTIKTKQKCTH